MSANRRTDTEQHLIDVILAARIDGRPVLPGAAALADWFNKYTVSQLVFDAVFAKL